MKGLLPVSSKPIVNPYLAVLAGVFAVSFSALFVRLLAAPPLIIATYRLLFTFLFLAPYTLFRYRTGLATLPWRQRGLAAGSGLCLALHLVSWFISLRYTSVASSVVLVTTQPVFVVIGSWIFFRERVSRMALWGGTLALVGSFIIGAADFQIGREAFRGDLLALSAAVCFRISPDRPTTARDNIPAGLHLLHLRQQCRGTDHYEHRDRYALCPLPCSRLDSFSGTGDCLHRHRPHRLQLGIALCPGLGCVGKRSGRAAGCHPVGLAVFA